MAGLMGVDKKWAGWGLDVIVDQGKAGAWRGALDSLKDALEAYWAKVSTESR